MLNPTLSDSSQGGESTRSAEAVAGAATLPAVPGYEILAELGRGGMGIVYQARQKGLDRLVALKMILAGDHADPEHRERFRREATAIARLRHPNIVQIYEIGEAAGRPFFSLELVEGGTLDDILRPGPLAPRTAARLIETLSRALAVAHEHGIIHRDLKPGNILIAAADGDRTAVSDVSASDPRLLDAIPKVTDFGLAKVVGEASHTRSNVILGTPSYMAPEQAAAGRAEQRAGGAGSVGADARTDVYALGAILYACVTGRPPFLADTPLETVLCVLADEPLPPTRLQPRLPRDLETISLHCLNKNAGRRYPSALALAEDLARFLAGEPITARPVGVAERALKWLRRRPAVASLLALVVLTAATGFGLVAWKWAAASRAWYAEVQQRRAADAARLSEQHLRLRAEEALYFNRIAFAERERSASNIHQAEDLLELCPPERRHWEWHYLKRVCRAELLVLVQHRQSVNSLAVSPDGKTLVSGGGHTFRPGEGGRIEVWTTDPVAEIRTLHGHGAALAGMCFHPDGTRLATAAYTLDLGILLRRAKRLEDAVGGEVRLWDVKTGVVRLHLPGYTAVAYSPDGKLLAAGRIDGSVVVWDPKVGGQPVLKIPPLPGVVTKVAYSADGKFLAATWMEIDLAALAGGEENLTEASKGGIKLWNARTGAEARSFEDHTAFEFSADGGRLAAAGNDAKVRVWDLRKAGGLGGAGLPLLTLAGHANLVNHVTFSRDGKRLATGSMDKTARIWDLATGRTLLVLRGHADMINDVRFSHDGRRLFSASWDGTVRVWSATADPDFRALRGHRGAVAQVTFGARGERLASVGPDGVRLWHVGDAKELVRLAEGFQCVALSPDGKHLAAAVRPNKAQVWDVDGAGAGRPPAVLFTVEGHAGRVCAVAFSPDGRLLVSGSVDPKDGKNPGIVILSEVATGRSVRSFDRVPASVMGLDWHPGGKRLAVGTADGLVQLRDTDTGAVVWEQRASGPFKEFALPAVSVAFSPDGQTLAVGSGDALNPTLAADVQVWDATDGRLLRRLKGHSAPVNGLAFSPDGQRLVTASWDMNRGAVGEVKVWDAAGGVEILTLPGHQTVAFSSDGRLLASVGSDVFGSAVVKIWDGTPHPLRRP